MRKSLGYQRRAMLRCATYNARVGGSNLKQFKEATASALKNRLGAKLTNKVLKRAMAMIDEIWLTRNCFTCEENHCIPEPPDDCPECRGLGFVKDEGGTVTVNEAVVERNRQAMDRMLQDEKPKAPTLH